MAAAVRVSFPLRLAVCLAVACAGAATSAAGAGDVLKPRVFGGTDDVNKTFPFAVTLENVFGKRFCSGSLLSPTWVLTAAHCLLPSISKIRFGDFKKKPRKTHKYSKVIKSVPHPSYTASRLANKSFRDDIGLLLVEPVPTHAFAKLSAVDYRTMVGHRAELAGFSPLLSPYSSEELWTRPLQRLEVMIVQCDRVVQLIDLHMGGPFICLQGRCGDSEIKASAPGDSGGPLLHDGRLAGVLSMGEFRITVGVYTPVSPYLDWIRSVIADETSKIKSAMRRSIFFRSPTSVI